MELMPLRDAVLPSSLPETACNATGAVAPEPGPAHRRPLKPVLKWAGGKRWLVPVLRELWRHHSHRRLVEPLCGGLAVALGLMPDRALLNDANPHLINFYRWVQRGLAFTVEMRNDRSLYYAHRERFNQLIRQGQAHTAEAAQLFFYLNRTGYNGLCRFNKRGEFNVPFGKYRRINYEVDLAPYREAFAGWEFRAGDFAAVPLEKDDFVYADPPYDVEFTQYAQQGFDWDDQVRLAEWLAGHPGPVVLSNQATERVVHLYQRLGFHLEFLDAPRMISSDGDRTPAREVLAWKHL
ncbi:MAG TPA: Dam family site-specific DNA-(adenine-N6)-methyltransferase [Limnochordales bacterium]|nr:Dam family site-specific DNA-(adenine-N6)-methyltransferase [Limnochordales bacterium]